VLPLDFLYKKIDFLLMRLDEGAGISLAERPTGEKNENA
jgi:hypothetical protein